METEDSEPFAPTSATAPESIGAAVLTVSRAGSLESDEAGDAIAAAFEDSGHPVATRELIQGGYDNVQSTVSRLIDRDDVHVVVVTGDTGVGEDEATLEAVDPLLEKELPAFADLFTQVCYEEVGTGVLCERALGGVVDGVQVYCLPDAVAATRLATESIVVPEAPAIAARLDGEGEGPDC